MTAALLRLNLGCGPLVYLGELGVDREATPAVDVRADLRALPFRSGCAEFVRLDHVLEHLEGRYALGVLTEARRVLAPGGRLRVGIPDLRACCQAYLDSRTLADKIYWVRILYGAQTHAGEYHKGGYDADSLRDLLEAAGIREIEITADEDRDEGLCLRAEGVA